MLDPWREQLSPLQFKVMRQAATEPPFSGEHLDQRTPGNYRCAACGQLLFYSYQKYHSGCGWPAFFAPAAGEKVQIRPDPRDPDTHEILCSNCGSHLGHVFPRDAEAGSHYCVNSVCLNFEAMDSAQMIEQLTISGVGAEADEAQVLGLGLVGLLLTRPDPVEVARLISRGADIRFSLPGKAGAAAGGTALTWAPNAAITRLLLQAGALPTDECPLDGLTSLHRAALAGDLDRIALLLGADRGGVHRFDYLGRTPLACAASGGHVGAIGMLLEGGSQINSWSSLHLGSTALMEAVLNDQREAGLYLLARGADPDLALGPNASPREVCQERGVSWV